LKSEAVTEFEGRGDHVMPQAFGTFEPENPILNLVCHSCNNQLSTVERYFFENSLEGHILTSLGIVPKSEIYQGENLKIKLEIGGESPEWLKEYHPFVDADGKNIIHQAHLAILHPQKKLILTMEQILGLKQKRKPFIKRFAAGCQIVLVTDEKYSREDVVRIVREELGIEYKGGFEELRDQIVGDRVVVEISTIYDQQSLRVPAKIAFNYFAYCAQKQGMGSILYENAFDAIRSYIYEGKPGRDLISINKEPVLCNQRMEGSYWMVHCVAFEKQGDSVVGIVSLCDYFRYQVVLGKYSVIDCYPIKVPGYTFGCGHAFNPVQVNKGGKRVMPLYTKVPIVRRNEYGLFCI